jgi:hypothetical protein
MKPKNYHSRSLIRPKPSEIFEDSRTKRQRTRQTELSEALKEADHEIEVALEAYYAR